MSSQGSIVTAAAITSAGILGAYYAYRAYADKVRLPDKWERIGTLKEINAYPVKSCGPVILTEAECALLGLKVGWLRDRILMVVDEKNNFISARGYPELLLVQPQVRNSILTLKHADMEPLHINLAEVAALQKSFTATVWGVQIPVWNCGYEASEWFSRLLDRSSSNYRLVYYASQECRTLRLSANPIYNFTKNDTGAMPDEVPFNLINQSSVDDLNSRLVDARVSAKNFRPNFVVDGALPYDEDKWKFVKIGDNVFEVIKPCTRCIMTTIDPETGVRDAKAEPLETLKTYRQLEKPEERKSAGNTPRMGLQMALRSPAGGAVRLNDTVYAAY